MRGKRVSSTINLAEAVDLAVESLGQTFERIERRAIVV